ncbi:jg4120, partial [Pararge aegeria aegeria]
KYKTSVTGTQYGKSRGLPLVAEKLLTNESDNAAEQSARAGAPCRRHISAVRAQAGPLSGRVRPAPPRALYTPRRLVPL